MDLRTVGWRDRLTGWLNARSRRRVLGRAHCTGMWPSQSLSGSQRDHHTEECV
jgi:hypothetical protein